MNNAPPITPGRWDNMTRADKSAAIDALVREGQSARQMGAALACNRNAILSHARRYKVRLASPPPTRPKPRAKLRTPRQPMRVLPSVPASTWAAHRDPVSLLDLADDTCRWPVGLQEGSKQMFCGDHAGRRGCCERHTGMAKGRACTIHVPLRLFPKLTKPRKSG